MSSLTRVGYELVREQPLLGMGGTYQEYRHGRTGARHIHVATVDDNWTFAVALPTRPTDATGVAHILEHAVLSGSERYPLKAPFFAMGTRSMKTFMNAMTYQDRTVYPFSSRNPADFANLLDLYLDCVFHPLLKEETFLREGHRFEFERPDDATSRLRIRGIVYNEMKGSMATPASIMGVARARGLFPGTAYENYAGGEPEHIPDLTWAGLREFYARFYHPGRAVSVTHGSLAVGEVLVRLEEAAQTGAAAEPPVDTHLPVARFTDPRVLEVGLPLGARGAHDGQAAVAWVTAPTSDDHQVLALTLLEELLLGDASAPLRRRLVESGLGASLADGTGLDASRDELVFAAGLKGVDPDRAPEVQDIVISVLQEVASGGFGTERVRGAIDRVELERRKISHLTTPHGIAVALELCGVALHGGDPYVTLDPGAVLAQLGQQAAAGLLEQVVSESLLANPHRVLLVLRPQAGALERFAFDETNRTDTASARLSPADRTAIVARSHSLALRQEQPEDRSCLPLVLPTDIAPPVETGAVTRAGGEGVPVLAAQAPVNGVVTGSILGTADGVPPDRFLDLALYSHALTRSGAGGEDHVAFAARVARFTGGLAAVPTVTGHVDDGRLVRAWQMGGSALARNSLRLFGLTAKLVEAPNFEAERLRQVMRDWLASREATIAVRGHIYAAGLAAGQLSEVARWRDQVEGLGLLRGLEAVVAGGGYEELAARFAEVHDALFAGGTWQVLVTSDLGEAHDGSRAADAVAARLGGVVAELDAPPRPEPARGIAVLRPVPVSYNAVAFPAPGYADPDAPAMYVLAQLVRARYLMTELREKGSAYGGAATSDPAAGVFTMSSYRDPNIARTYDVFDEVPRRLSGDDLPEDQVNGAILNAAALLDPLGSPGTAAARRRLQEQAGLTLERRREFLRAVLAVSADDLRRVASDHLVGIAPVRVTITSEAAYHALDQSHPGLLDQTYEAG